METLDKFELISDLLRDAYRSVRDEKRNRNKENEDEDEKFENDKKERKYNAYLDWWKSQMNQMVIKNFEFEENAKCVKMLNKHYDGVFCMSNYLKKDGKRILVSGGYDCEIRLWDAESFESVALLDSHEDAVTCLTTYRDTNDELFLASGSFDHTVRLWDLEGEYCYKTLTNGHTDTVKSILKLSKGGKDFILSGGADKKICVWDPHADKDNYTDAFYGHKAEINALRVIDESKFIFASGGSDNLIKVWEYENFKEKNCIKTIKGHSDSILCLTSIRISDDGNYLVSGSADWTLKLWNLEKLEKLEKLEIKDESLCNNLDGFGKTVSCVDKINIDGKDVIIAGSHDGNVKLFDVATKKCLKTIITDHFMGVFSITAIPSAAEKDKYFIITSGGDTRIKIWELQ